MNGVDLGSSMAPLFGMSIVSWKKYAVVTSVSADMNVQTTTVITA
ncbi:hypothetical protein [Sessilibacter corallicola]